MKQFSHNNDTVVDVRHFPIIVSLDVHASNIYMYAVNTKTGEIMADCNLPGKNEAVLKHLDKIRLPRRQSIIIYEAGSAGFSPYRTFTKAGCSCAVIAPTSIPKRPKHRKTDRLDTINNLNYCAAGMLRYVHIPSEIDESNRELLRYRYDLVYQATKQKQKILAYIKRMGIIYELTKTNWTHKHREWLRKLELDSKSKYLLDLMLKNLDSLESQTEILDKELDIIVSTDARYSATVSIIENIAGFGRLGAMTLALEIQDFTRFAHPNALMSYTGLIPDKHESGKNDPALRITKAGNVFLRTAYVCAAKSYRDRRLLRTNAFLKKQPEPIKEFLERLQDRLYSRYRHLCAMGKPSNKAKCAIARELCGFTWELLVVIAPAMKNEYRKAA